MGTRTYSRRGVLTAAGRRRYGVASAPAVDYNSELTRLTNEYNDINDAYRKTYQEYLDLKETYESELIKAEAEAQRIINAAKPKMSKSKQGQLMSDMTNVPYRLYFDKMEQKRKDSLM
jgi:hypothetical protein